MLPATLVSPSLTRAEFRTVPRDGETHNGDAAFVRIGAVTWLAVIDGLGHGDKAAQASSRAVEILGRDADDDHSIEAVMAEIDAALVGTRGAGALVCRVIRGKIEVCSVGNVALRSTPTPVGILLTPGILGRQVRRFRVLGADLSAPGRLLMFSDGIRRTASLEAVAGLDPGAACDAIIANHRDIADDSTVLIAAVDP